MNKHVHPRWQIVHLSGLGWYTYHSSLRCFGDSAPLGSVVLRVVWHHLGSPLWHQLSSTSSVSIWSAVSDGGSLSSGSDFCSLFFCFSFWCFIVYWLLSFKNNCWELFSSREIAVFLETAHYTDRLRKSLEQELSLLKTGSRVCLLCSALAVVVLTCSLHDWKQDAFILHLSFPTNPQYVLWNFFFLRFPFQTVFKQVSVPYSKTCVV